MTRRLLSVALALTVWVAGSVVGALLSQERAEATPLLLVGRAHAEHYPVLDGSEPIFVLVLGSDARPGTPVNRGLADSIHILGINPATRKATLFGIPRDSYVPISTGGTAKINTAMATGGPEAQIATVEALTGITFDYYALAGFTGFNRAIREVGGLTVDVPYTVPADGRTFEQGEQTLSGSEALAFARTRHYLPRGDFDRSINQGLLMVSALEQFRKDFRKDPSAVYAWLSAGLRNVETTLSIDELTSLAFLADRMNPAKVTNLVATGSIGSAGGASIVNLSDENRSLWQDLAEDGYIPAKNIPDEHLSSLG